MGDIGEPLKHIELEPLPDTVPVQEPAAPSVEPAPAPAPAEPAPAKEPVPA